MTNNRFGKPDLSIEQVIAKNKALIQARRDKETKHNVFAMRLAHSSHAKTAIDCAPHNGA